MELPDTLEELEKYYLIGFWMSDFLGWYEGNKKTQAVVENTKRLILDGPKLPVIPDDSFLVNENRSAPLSVRSIYSSAKAISGVDKDSSFGLDLSPWSVSEYLLTVTLGELIILTKIGKQVVGLTAKEHLPGVDASQLLELDVAAIYQGLKKTKKMRQFNHTDAQLLSYFALFSLTEYLSSFPRLVIKKEDARKKSANYVKALEASILNASSLTEAQDVTRFAVAQAYTDALDISKEEAEELNKRLGEAQRLVEEGEIKIRATEVRKADQIVGISERNAIVKSLQEEAKNIAKEFWAADKEKEIRITKMSEMVFDELSERNPKSEMPKHFPETSETVKEWIKLVAPEYARKGGRTKKKK